MINDLGILICSGGGMFVFLIIVLAGIHFNPDIFE